MEISKPKLLLHLEGLTALTVACLLYGREGGSWVRFAALFLAPDLLMLGYVFGKKIGAGFYNAGHTYAAPCLLWLTGYFVHSPAVYPLCLIWVAHIGADRLLGYGLKYDTDFKDTHLGRV